MYVPKRNIARSIAYTCTSFWPTVIICTRRPVQFINSDSFVYSMHCSMSNNLFSENPTRFGLSELSTTGVLRLHVTRAWHFTHVFYFRRAQPSAYDEKSENSPSGPLAVEIDVSFFPPSVNRSEMNWKKKKRVKSRIHIVLPESAEMRFHVVPCVRCKRSLACSEIYLRMWKVAIRGPKILPRIVQSQLSKLIWISWCLFCVS